MTELRDWPRTLKKASFRGVAFYVETDKVKTGRRLVVHEFPHRDDPYVEDMGRAANTITVTAYVVGDSADDQEAQLRRACDQGGAAALVLPIAKLTAHCQDCSRDFHKDKLGYIAFDLQFVREGLGTAPYGAPYLARMAFAGAQSVVTALAQTFSSLFLTTGQAGFVRDEAVAAIQAIAVAIDATRAALPILDTKGPGIALAVQDLFADAATLAEGGEIGDTYNARSFLATAAGVLNTEIVDRVAALVSDMRSATGDQTAAARELAALIDYGVDDSVPFPATPSVRQSNANVAALATVLRVAALAQWVVAKTEIDYGDRPAAIQARADVSELVDAEMQRLTGDGAYALYVALADLRGQAVTYFSRVMADLAPLVTASSAVSMPSLWWANTLYGDALRAEDLIDRNRAIHPSFMPPTIEALAR